MKQPSDLFSDISEDTMFEMVKSEILSLILSFPLYLLIRIIIAIIN